MRARKKQIPITTMIMHIYPKLLLILPLIIVGCATPKGPKFEQSGDAALTPPSDKALVFIIRTPTIVDSANSWYVGVNGEHLVTVPNGGYYSFTPVPGTLRFATSYRVNTLNFGLGNLFNKDREKLVLNVDAGKTYFLKLNCGEVSELPEDKGKASLLKCRRIPEEQAKVGRSKSATEPP
jgi:hypothetical protein